MNPTTIDLFTMALGLLRPWTCMTIDFSSTMGKLDIRVDFTRGAHLTCPSCAALDCPVHDTVDKQWRHLNFFQHECYLHARFPRVRCDACGVHLAAVPWASPGSGFTLLFEALVMAMTESMPVADVSRMVTEFDTKLWRIIRHHIEQALAHKSHAEVELVGR